MLLMASCACWVLTILTKPARRRAGQSPAPYLDPKPSLDTALMTRYRRWCAPYPLDASVRAFLTMRTHSICPKAWNSWCSVASSTSAGRFLTYRLEWPLWSISEKPGGVEGVGQEGHTPAAPRGPVTPRPAPPWRGRPGPGAGA